ncbi:hypothetical protein GH714_003249 [Hevea brasiliensis]|uniref:Exportin-5 C-terminal domain-containing protein n=1 Tax=Hevea brasiliensis TaxID=3981 RepID=A0A6A6KIN1_HEVBR|nr:hypothetical protein GH714_003249 [Hevea brasiliensis]
MTMSDAERFALLGEGNPKLPKGPLTFTDGSQFDKYKEGSAEINESDIRNWLKEYTVYGVQTYKAAYPCSFEIFGQVVSFRNVGALTGKGKAKVPDVHGILAGSDLKVEVMEEKLLQDLTRETCLLMSAIASPGLNIRLPSLEQSGHVSRGDTSSLKDLDAFVSNSMVGFLLKHKGLAFPALQICIEAFTWTDSEAVTKVSSFCAPVILLAIATNNAELREFVSKDLFYAIIKGLELESNAVISADLIGLCREIFMYLRDRDPAPRQGNYYCPCYFNALDKVLSLKSYI